ncbi:S10 family peptidase [Aquimarina sp. W85]|uniref:S10 family peptidase n=1 Tax=Aquimarina rhodophyticola TaxID=3342246 RepID=UPI00366BC82E
MYKNVSFCYTVLIILLCRTSTLIGQQITIPVDTMIRTNHSVQIKDKTVPYIATTGFQPVWDDNRNPIASLFYTYYKRSDIKDDTNRPLLISFNGGPGSASVWMHIAYTGPRILKIDPEGFPIQPYGIQDNPNSILDVADIVFVNPVNTGYSRMLPDHEGKLPDKKIFFGVNADIEYLSKWVNTFVTRNNRWRSPKFLIGESYGTTRVSGLALALQEEQWMYLNGVILVSPTQIGFKFDGPIEVANRLPYYTAAAWYHNKLPAVLQQQDLPEVLSKSEHFTIHHVVPSLVQGGSLPINKRNQLIDSMAYYSGLSKTVFKQHNLEVPKAFFWKELLRNDQGLTIGRLDSRYKGMDVKEAGGRPDYNSELTAWLHAFTPAINYYISEELNFKTDLKYNMFGPVHPWDRSNNSTGEALRSAMAMNPNLHTMIQSGYYDGATTYFNAKYVMWQLNTNRKLENRIDFKGYRSGHMMYLRNEDLIQANQDIRDFITKASKNIKSASKY